MKLNIGIKQAELNRDVLDNWIIEKSEQYKKLEDGDVKALFMPYASSEMCTAMVVQTLKQITDFSIYKRVVVIGNSHSRVTKGIYIPDGEPYRNEIVEFTTKMEPDLEESIVSLKVSTPISAVTQSFIDICDISYNLPFVASVTAQYMLPIIPITYRHADVHDISLLINQLIKADSLVIICGGLSHSLSINEAKSLDSELISKVIALDNSIRNTQSNSYVALNSLIYLAEKYYWRPRLISYQTTGTIVNVKNTAGYASIVFYRQ